ncbi:MAG: hypothetical protein M1829_006272 [Trizodia sp. TS-e1964]|nr:MAG: hypothetical protein M1829_006272 [Trizodia sp. TS-e1964]
MARREPSAQDIAYLVEVTASLNHHDARNFLIDHHNDVQAALQAFFDPPAQFQNNTNYDESAFHANRDGTTGSGAWEHNSFQIHSSNEQLPSASFFSRSRPPSRASINHPIDLTDAHKAADPSMSKSSHEREQDDINQALRLSMANLPPQETGVAPSSQPVTHGPLNREYYENSNWAVAIRAPSNQIMPNPDAANRKRQVYEPAFLKPALRDNDLGSWISIAHTIPMGREALLFREAVITNYGANEMWWDGAAIKTQLPSTSGATRPKNAELIYETQRLMAFLDYTHRAYGSVEVISNMSVIETGDDKVATFLGAWTETASLLNTSSTLIDTFTTTIHHGSLLDKDSPQLEKFQMLEINLDEVSAMLCDTLYDAIDTVVWGDGSSVNPFKDNTYFTQVGEIFTIRLTVPEAGESGKAGLGIAIPLTFYADRYLAKFKDLAQKIRDQIHGMHRDVAKIIHTIARLSDYEPNNPNVKRFDPRQVLAGCIKVLNVKPLATHRRPDGELVEEPPRVYAGMSTESLTKELQNIIDNVEKKLASLYIEKDKTQKTLKELSMFLTQPSPEEPKNSPTHAYTLRGVSTDPRTTFLLSPIDPDSESPHTPDAVKNMAQWWKFEFSDSEIQPIDSRRVHEKQVANAAKNDSKSVLLVYASKAAVNVEFVEPPVPLQNFAQLENRYFQAELEGSVKSSDSDVAMEGPEQPKTNTPKRKTPSYEEGEEESISWGGHRQLATDKVATHEYAGGAGGKAPEMAEKESAAGLMGAIGSTTGAGSDAAMAEATSDVDAEGEVEQ